MEILYKPVFIRQLRKLDKDFQQEVIDKIELLKNPANHQALKVHKLKGPLSDCYSFSVDYNFRVVFCYVKKKEIHLIAIGDHNVYKN